MEVTLQSMDPETRIRRLVDGSLDLLKFDKRISIRRYFRSGRELLRMANIYMNEGDHEKAFQLYFKYIS